MQDADADAWVQAQVGTGLARLLVKSTQMRKAYQEIWATKDAPYPQRKVTLTRRILTLRVYKAGVSQTYSPVATRRPGSIEIVSGTFQTK